MNISDSAARTLEASARRWAADTGTLRGGAALTTTGTIYVVAAACIIVGAIVIYFAFFRKPKIPADPSKPVPPGKGPADVCNYQVMTISACKGGCANPVETVQNVSSLGKEGGCPAGDPVTRSCSAAEASDCFCTLKGLNALIQGDKNVVITGTDCDGAKGGARCTLGCSDGFVPTGTAYATCGSDGTWDLPTFSCQPPKKSCPPLYNGDKHFYNGTCVNAQPGDKCNISCHAGAAPPMPAEGNVNCSPINTACSASANNCSGTCGGNNGSDSCDTFCALYKDSLGRPKVAYAASYEWTDPWDSSRVLRSPWPTSDIFPAGAGTPGVRCRCGPRPLVTATCGSDYKWDHDDFTCSVQACTNGVCGISDT